ncbi:MAG: OmpA family protein [Planctomycetota bacterium]
MIVVAVVAAGLFAATGCSSVQKGAAAGGATGAATGAAVGHYASTLGGVPGALIGLSVGSAGGAIAADHYGDPGMDEGALDEASQQVDQLSQQLRKKDQELAKTAEQLKKEKEQQKAVLQAYEKLRGKKGALSEGVPANVQVSADSDSITYTMLSEVLFDSGDAELKDGGKSTLQQAAAHIRQKFPHAEIEVRGHTDNVPIRYSPYKSNWELSCARAVSVVRHLIEREGFEAEKLMATGCGATRPVASNKSADGRRKNRRAEIIVRPGGVEVAEIRASDN